MSARCARMGRYGRRSILGSAHHLGFFGRLPQWVGSQNMPRGYSSLVSRGVNFSELRACEVRRIPLLLGTSVNKGGLRESVAEADGGIVAIQLPQLDHLTHRLLRRWFRPAGHVERS